MNPEKPTRTLPDHPVRVALLDLLAELGTVTANEASRRLGFSSGLCSFHLRQLARQGLIDEAPRGRGRVRPWRLRWAPSGEDAQGPAPEPPRATFSAVVELDAAELDALAAEVRDVIDRYRARAARGPTRTAFTVDFRAAAVDGAPR